VWPNVTHGAQDVGNFGGKERSEADPEGDGYDRVHGILVSIWNPGFKTSWQVLIGNHGLADFSDYESGTDAIQPASVQSTKRNPLVKLITASDPRRDAWNES
jgi:hypothetical protein